MQLNEEILKSFALWNQTEKFEVTSLKNLTL